MLRTLTAVVFLQLFASFSLAYDVGDTVVVIHPTKLKVEGSVGDDVWPGLPLTVTAVSGKWLWVSNGHPGWIESNRIVALDQAVPALTDLIRQNPRNPSHYRARGDVLNKKGQYDAAITDFNEALRISVDSGTYCSRGDAWRGKGDLDKAIADYSEAVRLKPSAVTYSNRGSALFDKGDLDKSQSDLNQAIRLDSQFVTAYETRGVVWRSKNEYGNAIKDFEEALRIDRRSQVANNEIAWIWATCPDPKYRNGAKAVEYATKACELTAWKDANILDTLAASCAEAGDFDKAIEWESKAIDLAGENDEPEYQSHLALYKSGTPYRDETQK